MVQLSIDQRYVAEELIHVEINGIFPFLGSLGRTEETIPFLMSGGPDESSPSSGRISSSSLSDLEDLEISSESGCLSIVVLGASGDLAKKKTFPALFNLFQQVTLSY